jgi:hypothetical protein
MKSYPSSFLKVFILSLLIMASTYILIFFSIIEMKGIFPLSIGCAVLLIGFLFSAKSLRLDDEKQQLIICPLNPFLSKKTVHYSSIIDIYETVTPRSTGQIIRYKGGDCYFPSITVKNYSEMKLALSQLKKALKIKNIS